MTQLATGYACSLNDLLVRFPYEKLESIKGTKANKRSVVKNIFKDSIKFILQDIIDNNDTFVLPTMQTVKSEIHMEQISDSEFERARSNGKFRDVDFLESMFKGYQLYLYMRSKRNKLSPRRKKPIYVNKFFKDQITKNTNEGKTYS